MPARIVAGVDGSAAALAAARLAAAEAAAGGCPLDLLHARLPVGGYALLVPPGLAVDTDAAGRSIVEAVRDDLARAYPDLQVRTMVTAGGAVAALLRASRSAGQLVVGRAGLASTRRALLGSTAGRVVAAASCPVTVVGPRLPERDAVVLGFDPADPGSPAVQYAFTAARRRGCGLRVCCVRPFDGGCWENDAAARRAVSEAIAGWRGEFADVPVALDVLAGLDPAARLLDASTEAGLMVIGAGDADVLVRNAACPVTVVRPSRRPVPGPSAQMNGADASGAADRTRRRSSGQLPTPM